MSSISNLTASTNSTVQACGKTAVLLIDAWRAGGNRLLNRIDLRWDSVVNGSAARLGEKIRHDLVALERGVSGRYARGIETVSGQSSRVVQRGVDVTSNRIDQLSDRIQRYEAARGTTPLTGAILLVQPFAEISREVANLFAERAAKVVSRIQGTTPDKRVAANGGAPVKEAAAGKVASRSKAAGKSVVRAGKAAAASAAKRGAGVRRAAAKAGKAAREASQA